MIRLLLRILRINDFETCKSCETLRIQLEIANQERAQLLSTILGLVKPEVIQSTSPTVVAPIFQKSMPWSVRARIMEEQDKLKAQALRKVEKLEEELEIKDAGRELSGTES